MSTLGGMLGSRSGLGMGASQPASGFVPNPTATAGIPSMSTVGRVGEGTRGLIEGRVSLVLIEGMILGLVLFYVWTKNVQGGG